jgi:hypothetical protein
LVEKQQSSSSISPTDSGTIKTVAESVDAMKKDAIKYYTLSRNSLLFLVEKARLEENAGGLYCLLYIAPYLTLFLN